MNVTIIGGGAAGFFAAIHCKETFPSADVVIVEKSDAVLSKVKISGGGRCNVTHACFEPRALADHYPRGGKALIGPFHQFGPRDTMAWFENRGVPLKIEADNRVFPESDSSHSIITCLLDSSLAAGVRLWRECGVTSIRRQSNRFELALSNGETRLSDCVILATGSGRHGHTLAENLGHRIVPPVPSLFTVKIDDPALTALAGVSVAQVNLKLGSAKPKTQSGPLLITHWGFSGPATIKLSAWAARDFHDSDYRLPLTVSWLPDLSLDTINDRLNDLQASSQKSIGGQSPFPELSGRLWVYLVQKCIPTSSKRWNEISKKELNRLAESLKADAYSTTGKSTFKDEFVTCGGVELSEVDFKTMQSRLVPGLFFTGEVLDVDGVTGGFNFQNAWTTGYLAGLNAIASS